MSRKSKKQQALELLQQLNKDELKEIIDTVSVKEDTTCIDDFFDKLCPECGYDKHYTKGKNAQGLTIYKCKNCGKQFNVLSGTPLEKSPYSWNVWVTILEKMFANQSIDEIKQFLVKNKLVNNISRETVSAMVQKLRNSFITMPLPVLNGTIQVDEKFFHESQKGSKNPNNVLIPGSTRKPHHRATPSQYGTMGPEFSTTCVAVDFSGHAVAKVVCMGQMKLEDFEDNIAIHFGDVKFLCSDMNTLYIQYSALNKINHYVINSESHKFIKKCNSDRAKQAAYEQGKLDYLIGVGIMHYKQMCAFRDKHNLSIGIVNAYHSELERYINHIAKGVSTKHLQSWISFFNYRWNYKVDFGYTPTTYADAEKVLVKLLEQRTKITVEDIKTKTDDTKKQPPRYTKKLIAKTVAARIRSNNPYIKFSVEDGIWLVDKRGSIYALPEYKRRELAKALGIKPFSPIAVSSVDLKKKLLAHPGLEDALYVLASGDGNDL